jgi:hypothetical protein
MALTITSDNKIEMKRGDSGVLNLTFDTPITGGTVYFVVKVFKDDADEDAKILKTTTEHTGEMTTTVTILPVDTDLPVMVYYYSIVYKYGTTVRHTVLDSVFIISQGTKDI